MWKRWGFAFAGVFFAFFTAFTLYALGDSAKIYAGTVLGFALASAGLSLMVMIFFAPNAGPDWMWQGRRRDPFRNILFRADGSWRRYGKLGVVAFWAAILIVGYFVR